MRLIILGAPGSGKGTQAKLLAKKYHLKHLSAGEMGRREIARGTKYGKAIQKYIDSGLMAPDNIITKIFFKHLPKDNFVLDGIPRNKGQIRYFKKIRIDKVIFIKTSRKEALKRLRIRRNKEKRTDDSGKIIKTRFKVFHKEMPFILRFYKSKLIKVNGNQSIKKAFKEIVKKLN